MNSALETIFMPFRSGVLKAGSGRVLFLGAHIHSDLKMFNSESLSLVQPYKPYVDALEQAGYVAQAFPPDHGDFDMALALCPKNITETRYWLALAMQALKPGGALVAAAENKAGGTRLKKMLQQLGFEAVSELSKNKARVCRGQKSGASEEALNWLESGMMQPVLDGQFFSQPGIFGWDKIDQGSRLLLEYLPADLKGAGADFGCGYGYLSRGILENCPDVKSLFCIDADARAVEACRMNLKAFEGAELLWADLAGAEPPVRDLDFIVMNPPFHEGKTEASAIGQAFIRNAYDALKPKGQLVMAANAHLPYERVLADTFFKVEKLCGDTGFKVFLCGR